MGNELIDPKQQGPGLVQLRELQSYSFTEWDTVTRVKAAVRSLEMGHFDLAGQLWDSMVRDDRLGGCMMTRSESICSLPLSFTPGAGPKADACMALVEEKWAQILPDDAITDLLKQGLGLGLGVGEWVWNRDDESGFLLPQLKVWPTRWVFWRWDTRSYWLMTEAGNVEIDTTSGQWCLFAPYGLRRAWMGGLIRRLFIPWLLRQWASRDSGRYSEVYGSPMRKAKVPPGAKDEDVARFVRAVAGAVGESVIKLPSDATGTGWDVELLEAEGNGFEGFISLIDKQDANIAIAILGQNLTTEVKGGSYAAAGVHNVIRNDLLRGDAKKFCSTVKAQGLAYVARYNFGSAEDAPTPCYVTEPPEDKDAAAKALGSLGDAITKLRTAGLPLDTKKIVQRFNVPVTENAPDELEAQEADPNADDEEVDDEKPTKPVKRSHDNRAAIEAQLRIDDLAEDAEHHARPAADLEKLTDVVRTATSLDDMKAQLLKAFGKMTRPQLSKVLSAAYALAELEGRFAATLER